MEIETLINKLQKIKVKYPNLSNDELLRLMLIKTLIKLNNSLKIFKR